MPRPPYTPNQSSLHTTVPFATAEEVWRDRDPATIARVTEGFKQLYG